MDFITGLQSFQTTSFLKQVFLRNIDRRNLKTFCRHAVFSIFTVTISLNEEHFLRFPAPFIYTDLSNLLNCSK